MQYDPTPDPYFPENLDDYAPWVAEHGLVAPYGECQCGCGENAPVATHTRNRDGIKKGMPQRYISGHNAVCKAVTESKACNCCGINKPLEDFHLNRRTYDSRATICKECRAKKNRQYYLANTDAVKKRVKEYYLENADQVKRRTRKYAVSNKARLRRYFRKYYLANRRRYSSQRKQRYRTNPEKERERNRRRWHNNRDKYNRTKALWKKRNPELFRNIQRRYRARRDGADGSHSAQEWIALVKRFGNRCLACQKRFPIDELTVDHVVPISKGGTDDIENIQPLCRPCNSSKSAKIIDYRY